MVRALSAIAGIAAVCGAASVLLYVAVLQGLPITGLVLVAVSAALVLASVSAAMAYRAFQRSAATARDLQRLNLSITTAMQEFSSRGSRDSAAIAALNARFAAEVEALSERIVPPAAVAQPPLVSEPSPRTNVVPHPAARKSRHQAANASLQQTPGAGVTAALQRAQDAGRVEISLQPIISATQGSAGGFEVHVHLDLGDEPPLDVRRMQPGTAGIDRAAFERMTVVAAAEAARRQIGEVSEAMPLHVAISEALLQSGAEFAAVLELFRQYPPLAKSLVLSLPSEIIEASQHNAALDLLGRLDVRLAAEGWSGSEAGLGRLRRAGTAFAKLAADRLLDRTRARKMAPAATLLELAAAAGVEIIATDVRNDEDAVGLIDLGIDLMAGDRFSGPRRLKPDAHSGRTIRQQP